MVAMHWLRLLRMWGEKIERKKLESTSYLSSSRPGFVKYIDDCFREANALTEVS